MSAVSYALLSALIMVESGGNDRAFNAEAKAVGCLQITPVMVEDVRRITGQPIAHSDAFDRRKSCEIALVYLSHYATKERLGHEPTARDYALIWRYGPNGWKRPDPNAYWTKVKKHLP
jgi:hypothetical protein